MLSKKHWSVLVVFALAGILAFSCAGCRYQDETPAVRTVSLEDEELDYQAILEGFQNSSLVTSGTVTTFTGFKLLDASVLDETDLVAIEENLGEGYINVRYEISVDTADNNVILSAIMDSGEGEPVIDSIQGLVMEDESGKLDVMFLVDNQPVMLSELSEAGLISNVGFWSFLKRTFTAVAKAVVTTVAPAVTAVCAVVSHANRTFNSMTILSNYQNNLKQSFSVIQSSANKVSYIENQKLFTSWRYGCYNISYNGCGSIAAYNALVHLGKIKNTSYTKGNVSAFADLIRTFEKYNGTIFMGVAGTNPTHIAPYFLSKNIRCVSFTGLVGQTAFEAACNYVSPRQVILLAYWYKGDRIGAHFVAINKVGNTYYVHNDSIKSLQSITTFLHLESVYGLNGFIQGWIVG